jgi:hypothetical protein
MQCEPIPFSKKPKSTDGQEHALSFWNTTNVELVNSSFLVQRLTFIAEAARFLWNIP